MKNSDVFLGQSISFYNINHPRTKINKHERCHSDRFGLKKINQTSTNSKSQIYNKIIVLKQSVYQKRKETIKKMQLANVHRYQSFTLRSKQSYHQSQKKDKQFNLKTKNSRSLKDIKVKEPLQNRQSYEKQLNTICGQNKQGQQIKRLPIAKIQFKANNSCRINTFACVNKPKKHQSVLKNFDMLQENQINGSKSIQAIQQLINIKSSLYLLNLMKRQKIPFTQRLKSHIGNDLKATRKINPQKPSKQIKQSMRYFLYEHQKRRQKTDNTQFNRKTNEDQSIIAPW